MSRVQYEHLDHPADIQLHAWGDTMSECFEQTAMAMFAYITDDLTDVEPVYTFDIEATGRLDTVIVGLL